MNGISAVDDVVEPCAARCFLPLAIRDETLDREMVPNFVVRLQYCAIAIASEEHV